jgi:hypothetical protein
VIEAFLSKGLKLSKFTISQMSKVCNQQASKLPTRIVPVRTTMPQLNNEFTKTIFSWLADSVAHAKNAKDVPVLTVGQEVDYRRSHKYDKSHPAPLTPNSEGSRA